VNYERLYEYRFREVDQRRRQAVWNEIAAFVHRLMGAPRHVLDPAAGRCEFLNAIDADERWAVDASEFVTRYCAPGVKVVVADVATAALPPGHFDGVFVSNFLEHCPNPEYVASFLAKMREAMSADGTIAVLGPNFRYCARDYFDCADHSLALTHVAVAEHLYAAGFTPTRVVPRFLPYSFRSALPASAVLTRAYLRFPPAWRVLGKQFLVLARPAPSGADRGGA
jgi:hypothetical protein